MNKFEKLTIFLKEYLPMFFLLCLSGNPIFTAQSYSKSLLAAYTLLFCVYVIFTIDLRMLRKIFSILGTLVIIIFILIFFQRIVLGFVSYPGVFGFMLKMVLGICTLYYYQYEKVDFINTYIKTLTMLVIISIPLDALNQLGTFGLQTGNEYTRTIIIYTAWVKEPHTGRNFGMFWEPGAHAGYLILALVFIALKNGKFQIGPYRKEVFWIVAGLLTTGSTTGIVVLGVIVMIFSLQNYSWGKILVIPIFILGLNYAYFSFDFLQKKIEEQFLKAEKMDESDVSNTRFGALKMDWQYIKSQPLIGNGLHIKTRFRFHPQIKEDFGHGNGMSNFLACWGIPVFLFWLYCVYRFARKVSHSSFTALTALFIIILILQGEQFLNFPLFLSFFFLPFIYQNILSVENKVHFIKTYFNVKLTS
jgi:hypothetical protein